MIEISNLQNRQFVGIPLLPASSHQGRRIDFGRDLPYLEIYMKECLEHDNPSPHQGPRIEVGEDEGEGDFWVSP
jgi:hypothetical protein